VGVDEVLETFKALENTDSGDDAYRGRTGPVSVRQRTYDELTPGLRGFIDASIADGYKHVDDFNGGNSEGVNGCPVNILDGVRPRQGRRARSTHQRHPPP
jgi:choline dehydrogenase